MDYVALGLDAVAVPCGCPHCGFVRGPGGAVFDVGFPCPGCGRGGAMVVSTGAGSLSAPFVAALVAGSVAFVGGVGAMMAGGWMYLKGDKERGERVAMIGSLVGSVPAVAGIVLLKRAKDRET